jgi:hypothetical protein
VKNSSSEEELLLQLTTRTTVTIMNNDSRPFVINDSFGMLDAANITATQS